MFVTKIAFTAVKLGILHDLWDRNCPFSIMDKIAIIHLRRGFYAVLDVGAGAGKSRRPKGFLSKGGELPPSAVPHISQGHPFWGRP